MLIAERSLAGERARERVRRIGKRTEPQGPIDTSLMRLEIANHEILSHRSGAAA